MYTFFQNRRKKGQSLIEYGLIITLISVVAMGALSSLGEQVNGQLGAVSSKLAEVCTGDDCPE